MPAKKRASAPTIEELVDTEPGRLEAIWREVRRPLMWMSLAFLALVAVVLVGTSERGAERLAALPGAIGALVGRAPPASVTEVARVELEIARLREEARRTSTQRVALEQRLAELERGFGDVTGTIRRAERGEITGSIARPAGEPSAEPELPPREPLPAREDPGVLPRTEGPPAGGVTVASRSQFGIDLGSEATLASLRSRWQRLAQRHGPALGELEPVIVVREGAGGRPALHIVAGPIADVSDAAAMCARLRAAGLPSCQPASYDGQRLNPR